jgi:hypothetical protein
VAPAPSPTGSWYAVDYADGKWIALGQTADVATSVNGSAWTEHAVPSGSWKSVAYGNGRFVALSSVGESPHEMDSTNGINWSTLAGPSGQLTGLTFGAGRFVGVGSQGQIVTSANGVSWTTTFSRKLDDFTSVAFGNGRFIAVDSAQGDTLLSTDGIHWAFYTSPMAGLHWGAVTYGDGNFVAFDGSNAGYVATTVLGAVWAMHRYAPAQGIDSATYGCGSFVASGGPSGSTNDFFSSPTGASWTGVTVPTDSTSDWTSVGYGAKRYVAVDSAGNIAWAKTSANCSATTPTSPQQVSGNIRSGQIWTYMHPPVSSGGAPILGYRVNVTDGVINKSCNAPVYFEPNCIIKGLKNHHVYWVTTQSHNRFGYSVPTDPEVAIPDATASFDATATSVMSSSSPVLVQVTGVAANGEGIYPTSLITVHFGTKLLYCHPNPFGEYLITVPNPNIGPASIFATYTGYGRSYRSPTNHVTVAEVTLSTTNVAASQKFTVTIRGGIDDSLARVNFGARSVQKILNGVGSGSIVVTAPVTPGTFYLVVIDAGVGLERVSVTVHS